jgi:plasmid stabilization system protein ParE
MKCRIELAATAKANIRGQAQWLREQVAPLAADKWLAGLYKAIDALQTRPLRCPVATESDKFPEEIRELLHGRQKRHKHRIIFNTPRGYVYVLYTSPLNIGEQKRKRQEQSLLRRKKLHEIIRCDILLSQVSIACHQIDCHADYANS